MTRARAPIFGMGHAPTLQLSHLPGFELALQDCNDAL
jgi:hypothetical protein